MLGRHTTIVKNRPPQNRILKGARPGDLPIEQLTKFLPVLNVRTAKALGVEILRDRGARGQGILATC
jgi:hypothetical protein